jgi:hypothetical protein
MMDNTIIYLTAFVTMVAIAVATAIIAVRRDGRGAGDLIKQIIIWVCIAALLPLTSYAGANMLHPQKPMRDLVAQQQRVQQETYDTQDVSKRETARNKADALRKEIESERRAFYQAMFWVGFPIGFATLVAGLFVRTVPVGSGLAFGGLCTLTAGCYSYWNDMGDTLRFVSLVIVLISVTVIGLIRYQRPPVAA